MEYDIIDSLKREFSLSEIIEVQSKKGVYVFQVEKQGVSYYLKYFKDLSDATEIQCYKFLAEVDIPLVEYYQCTENAILLQDMNKSELYRLGCEEDLVNENSIKSIARWFKKLHTLTENEGVNVNFLHEETIIFKEENLMFCKEQFGHKVFFDNLYSNINKLNDYLLKCEKVIIHDDFYYKNFFTRKDNHEIIVFDFNYMKKGLRSQELNFIRKAFRLRSSEAERLFVEQYGEYDSMEYDIYTLYDHIDCLFHAAKSDIFPSWGLESKRLLNEGELSNLLESIINKL